MILATQLGPRLAAAVRALLDDAFGSGFTDADWEHCLGGTHALIVEGGDPVAHGAVVPRTLWHGGRALRCGYVEGVAVRADHRGHGHAAEIMEALEEIIREGRDLGALSSTEAGRGLYLARGWPLWRGPTSVRTPDGDVRTPEDQSVHVLPLATSLDLDGELTCDWRPGDPW
jgi:aminoglycoside 2'-N-acetyltransferase I